MKTVHYCLSWQQQSDTFSLFMYHYFPHIGTLAQSHSQLSAFKSPLDQTMFKAQRVYFLQTLNYYIITVT